MNSKCVQILTVNTPPQTTSKALTRHPYAIFVPLHCGLFAQWSQLCLFNNRIRAIFIYYVDIIDKWMVIILAMTFLSFVYFRYEVCVRICGHKASTCLSFHIGWSFHAIFVVFFFSFSVDVVVFVIFSVYFGQIELLKVKGVNGSHNFFFIILFEYNLWWSQKICELRFMQIKRKITEN